MIVRIGHADPTFFLGRVQEVKNYITQGDGSQWQNLPQGVSTLVFVKWTGGLVNSAFISF